MSDIDNKELVTETGNSETTVVETKSDNKTADTPKEQSYTQKDIDAIIQKRLSEQREKLEQKHKDDIAEEKRLAKLSADEREKELMEKQRKEQSQIAVDLTLRENRLSGKEYLNEKGLPTNFIETFLGEDLDAMKANIDNFKKEFDAEVDRKVQERISGKTGKDVNTHQGNLQTSNTDQVTNKNPLGSRVI